MTVATLKDVLAWAVQTKSAVAGLVVLGWEDARAFVDAAEETGLPIILQAGPGARASMPIAIWGKMLRTLAEQTRVPIVCHVDHATTVDECRAGIDAGFSSVMIDGSRLPLEKNIELTNQIISFAQTAGVSVEGEIGFVGYDSGEASAMTLPEEAARFERETSVDALAISVGNVHLNTAKNAAIDFVRLREIEAVTRAPLVLHGGSGIPVHTRQKLARETRVKKFNIGTELRQVFGRELRKSLRDQPQEFDRIKLLKPVISPMVVTAKSLLLELAGAPDLAIFRDGSVEAGKLL
jgi:fructose-bisphosphate aldolase, class II